MGTLRRNITIGLCQITTIFLLDITVCGAGEVPAGKLALILQTTIDAPQLQTYYHEKELPDRKPLTIVLSHIPASDIHLRKFNLPVIITIAKKGILNQPCLVMHEIMIIKSSAKVRFSYPVEGIRGTITLQEMNLTWKITNINIVED